MPTPQAAAPAQQRPAASPASTRASMTLLVTDRQGKALADVDVVVTGATEREGKTDEVGNVVFRNLGAGTYRLRFEHPSFITLERELNMQAGRAVRTSVALHPAPAPPALPEKEEAPTPPPAAPQLPPPGSQPPTFVSIPDVFEANPIGRDPSRTSIVGCAGVATATLIQVRDPLAEHTHDDADEALYVVAGEGVERIAGRDVPLTPGTLAMVPRGTAHTITRQGSKVLVVLSTLSGPPCTAK
jgi:mannose-6-phosphate isomerase-like protein (cupin superfamily)